MILGAIYAQVPLIEAAKRLGYHTIVTSIPGDYPGFSIADTCCYANITDPDEVLEAAEKYQIDGIVTCGMDTGVVAMGRVCDALGLPGISEKTARTASNKFLSKNAFAEGGVRCAKYRQVRNTEELRGALEDLELPVVVKAVDLMGSRGICRCDTKEAAEAAFEAVMEQTRQDYCLVEEFIDGKLFGADGMFSGGRLIHLLPFGTEACCNGDVATPVGHWAPLETVDHEEVRQIAEAAGKALGFADGPFNCDLMEKDGKVWLIEVNARAGATCIPEIVSNYYGCSYYEILCRQAVGEPVEDYFNIEGRKPTATIAHLLGADMDGVLQEIINENLPSEDIQELTIDAKKGDLVRRYKNGRDRLGQVIVTGADIKACRRRYEEVMGKIRLVVKEEAV